nr:hypothetical protein [Bradyrhizobium japonicum]
MLAAIGLLATATSFGLVAYEMNKFLDAQLQEIAVNVGPGDRKGAGPLLESEDEDQLVVRIWDRSGALVHRAGPPIDIPWQSVSGLSDVTADGQDWRVYRWSHAQHDIQIAQAWSARHEIALHAATGAALPLLLAIPLLWAVLGWSISRTMGGLQRLSAEIGQRSVDAQEPLRPVGVPAEVAPLIVAIDKLVDRHRSRGAAPLRGGRGARTEDTSGCAPDSSGKPDRRGSVRTDSRACRRTSRRRAARIASGEPVARNGQNGRRLDPEARRHRSCRARDVVAGRLLSAG